MLKIVVVATECRGKGVAGDVLRLALGHAFQKTVHYRCCWPFLRKMQRQ